VNVARASLDELLLDYEDFLRQRGKRQWKKEDREAREVRAVGVRRDPTDRSDPTDPSDHWRPYAPWLEQSDPAVVANAVLCLIHQANYLLDQQIAALEREFIHEGGYTEQLAAARIEARRMLRGTSSDPSDPLIGPMGRIPRRSRWFAPLAASRWSCAQLAKTSRLELSSGAARATQNVKARASRRDSVPAEKASTYVIALR
jgi:four helix bundle suffix protein